MIDQGKKYTYAGRPARILATNIIGAASIAVAVDHGEYEGVFRCAECALIEIKPVIERWVNAYKNDDFCVHDTRKDADDTANDKRIACIPISFREGDGLEPKPVAEAEWVWPDCFLAPWIVQSETGNLYASKSEPYLSGDGWDSDSGLFVVPRCAFNPPPYTDFRLSKRKNPRVA